jgi:hypothetical protein
MTHHYENREDDRKYPEIKEPTVSVEFREGLNYEVLNTDQPPYTPKKEIPVSDICCDASDREYRNAVDARCKKEEESREKPKHCHCPVPPVAQAIADRNRASSTNEEARRKAPKCLKCGEALMDNDLMAAIERRAYTLGTLPGDVYNTLKLQILQAEVDKIKRNLASNKETEEAFEEDCRRTDVRLGDPPGEFIETFRKYLKATADKPQISLIEACKVQNMTGPVGELTYEDTSNE